MVHVMFGKNKRTTQVTIQSSSRDLRPRSLYSLSPFSCGMLSTIPIEVLVQY